MDLVTTVIIFVFGVWVGSRFERVNPRGGGWLGPKDSKPMQPQQLINPRPRGPS